MMGNPNACKHWREALRLFKEVDMQPKIEQVQGWLDEAGCPKQN